MALKDAKDEVPNVAVKAPNEGNLAWHGAAWISDLVVLVEDLIVNNVCSKSAEDSKNHEMPFVRETGLRHVVFADLPLQRGEFVLFVHVVPHGVDEPDRFLLDIIRMVLKIQLPFSESAHN